MNYFQFPRLKAAMKEAVQAGVKNIPLTDMILLNRSKRCIEFSGACFE